ncbi:DUF4352 domain-containing protein [Paenibacillus psychroresistens]|uniref:DUF4352 domain-containing protein n=1 Tax=Paenibacillus psychroresistens TaxID=1778678 RepID=A0A6B8RLZ6_9BACL|nr:DUF4352 domain-containing protein [Paenibacillus psychroresistens]QGQ97039.1 DUF4352 domain-containing protein [Paenibacillus psychroresistens]
MKKAYLLTLLFVIALAGCTEAKIEKVEKPAATQAAEVEKTAEASAAPATPDADKAEAQKAALAKMKEQQEADIAAKTFSIGDTVKFNDLEITLNGVRGNKGSDFDTPEEAMFIILDLTIENKGTDSAAISTLMSMALNDAESFKLDVALFTDVKGSLDGELAAGRKVRGEVAFDAPESAYYEFIYSEPFSKGQAIWKFGMKK